MKQKVIQDSRQLAHPKWKVFFDSLFMLGVFLLIAKLVMVGLNYFAGTGIIIPDGWPKVLSNFLPLALMLIDGIGSDQLKNKYAE